MPLKYDRNAKKQQQQLNHNSLWKKIIILSAKFIKLTVEQWIKTWKYSVIQWFKMNSNEFATIKLLKSSSIRKEKKHT